MAPGVELMSYRVFGHGRAEATNFSIAKAIDTAVAAICGGTGAVSEITKDAAHDLLETARVHLAERVGSAYKVTS